MSDFISIYKASVNINKKFIELLRGSKFYNFSGLALHIYGYVDM